MNLSFTSPENGFGHLQILGLVDVDAGLGRRQDDGPHASPDLSARLVERLPKRDRARDGADEQHRPEMPEQPAHFLAALFDTRPQLDRGLRSGPAQREQVGAGVGAAAKLQPGALAPWIATEQ